MRDPIAAARDNWVAAGWPEAAPGMAAVTSVMRAQQLLQGLVDEVLRPLDLTFARYELLMLLAFSRRGALPLKKASERLQVHPTSVTNSTDRLERAGLVRRRPHPTDGRATLVEITDEGRRVAEKATDALNAAVFTGAAVSGASGRRLLTALTALRRDLGDLGG